MLEGQIGSQGGQWVQVRTVADGSVEGKVIDADEREKTFEGEVVLNRKTRKPRVEWVITLQTEAVDAEDDGVRKLSVNESGQRAIGKAVKEAGRKGVDVDGFLKFGVKTDPTNDREQAEYQARYTPPAALNTTAAAPVDPWGPEGVAAADTGAPF